MRHSDSAIRPAVIRRSTILQAAAAALVLAITLPAMAYNRPVSTRVLPTYPSAAKNSGFAGPVVIDVTVDPRGSVTNVKPVGGNSMLAFAAEKAIRQWKFAPAEGTSVEQVKINFNEHKK